jgi:excisionase family DNA binding protein
MEANMNEANASRNGPMDIDDAAEFLRLKKNFIYQLVFKKKLPAYKPGGKKLYFRQCDLEDYAFRNRQTADHEAREPAGGNV